MYMIWLGWVLWHINHCRLFIAKSSLYIYIKYIWFGLVWFYGIPSSFLPTVECIQVLLYNSHNLSSIICMHAVCSIQSIDRTLSGVTIADQSGPGSNDYKGVLYILQISSHATRLFNVISRTFVGGGLTPQQRCCWCIIQSQPTRLKISWHFGSVAMFLI